MVQVQKERRFQGASRPAAARLKARMSFPPGCFQQPGDGCNHVWGYGNVQVFTLLFLPAQSAQVPVIAKNVTLDHGEDHPYQDSARFFTLAVFPAQSAQVPVIEKNLTVDCRGDCPCQNST